MQRHNCYSIENGMVLPRATRAREVHTVTRDEARRAAIAATERRLSQLKLIRARAEEAREEIEELKGLGVDALRKRSASFVSMIRPGMRLEPEEAHAAQMAYLESRLACDEHEVKLMENALECVSEDRYYTVLERYYACGYNDAEIGRQLGCDKSTVTRHRSKLVEILAVRLYGPL